MPDRLVNIPIDPATLTERQREALDIVRVHAPIDATKLGCLLGYRGGYWRENGMRVLHRLKALGLVRERAGKRFELSDAGKRALGTHQQGGEIPY